VIFELFKRKRL